MKTRILKVQSGQVLGRFSRDSDGRESLESWEVPAGGSDADMASLREAGEYLRTKDIPLAFPTETVYGLGADATRSGAVKGIYAAKGRPSDNPLIVHVSDLEMLRSLLSGSNSTMTTTASSDLIPGIYKPLIEKFWPGPLTLLLPNPDPSQLAPEVTAGLRTFGVRMPASPLARTLIKLAGAPLAAPSANASTKPSPTSARHVLDDLDGRIELVLDGGPCHVGVESTVVDGLCDPPVVLRPGGVSMDELRACGGAWARVEKAYRDGSELGGSGGAAPRAPGMKYKHYSPKARVVLYERSFVEGREGMVREDLETVLGEPSKRVTVGVVRTRRWPVAAGLRHSSLSRASQIVEEADADAAPAQRQSSANGAAKITYDVQQGDLYDEDGETEVGAILDIHLGRDVRSIAQGLFSALRELDSRGADVIFVEGIGDEEGIAAAVMNRLRKAASEIKT